MISVGSLAVRPSSMIMYLSWFMPVSTSANTSAGGENTLPEIPFISGQAAPVSPFEQPLPSAWIGLIPLIVIVQVLLALWMFGKIGRGPAPAWVGPTHRLVGTLAFLVSLPIAYHCLWSLGFESSADHARRFWHSLFGCAFYGVFTLRPDTE